MSKRLTNHRMNTHSEKGQALILIVFSIIGLVGISALAIDGGNAYLERRKVQNAADAAALSGAIARIEGQDWRGTALATAFTNGYDNDGVTNTVELNTPPIDGPHSEDPEYIQVIVTSYLDTYFGPVIGVPEIKVAAQAVSQTKPSEYGPMFNGYALVSLAPHSQCDKKISFLIQGEATLALRGGGLFVNSDNPTCAYIQMGSGSVRIADESPFSIVGGASIQKPALHTPYPPQTGAIPMAYPPAIQMPKVGCGNQMATIIGEDGSRMTPGNWEEDFPPEGVTHLESGVYCINGDFFVGDGEVLIGDGVILKVENGAVKLSSRSKVKLTAPNNGSNAGLLLYMPLNNHKRLSLNGGYESSFKGTIFAPGAEIHLNGLESPRGFHSQIIGYTIEVDGTDIIYITYTDDDNYDAYRMPEVLLSQ